MPRESRTLALVESPAQLLHVLEWRNLHRDERVQVMILAPRQDHGRAQLTAMLHLANDCGVEVSWLDPRRSHGGRLRAWSGLRHRVTQVAQVLVGDPFSGLIQAILVGSRVGRVVVVDDGTATIDFAESLVGGLPLLRWSGSLRSSRTVHTRRALAGQASRFFTGFPADSFELFTAMPVQLSGIATVTRNDYRWTRSRFGPPQVTDELTVIGSSLVESRLLTEDGYLTALRNTVRTLDVGGGRYLPHRREHAEKLARVQAVTGLRVVRPTLPLEIELRRGPVGRHIVCFPSTPAYTMPLVLSDTDVQVTVLSAEPGWFDPHADQRAAEFVSRLGRP